ncbi:MAG: helix-turn-helix domain-containing protein [Eubacteriales bacterium]|nr:helix-turn-helix domain-containing protein [Eubacteriales bacterium]
MDRLLTKADVCELLGISRPTLDRIVADGDLEPLRIRGQVRFYEQDLLRYLGRCREQKAAKPAAGTQKGPAVRGRPKGSRNRPKEQQYYPGMRVV